MMQTNLLRLRSFFGEWKNHDLVLDLGKVLPPFLVSRILLLIVGFFSYYLQPNTAYRDKTVLERGYFSSPVQLVDMWTRYDSGWYLTIVNEGYYLRGAADKVQSNIAFYPLYPMLVKFISSIKPAAGSTFIAFIGIMLSNTFFLVSLLLLKRLVNVLGFANEVADRSAWYLALFPTSFFFSSFYTESLFLMLSLAVFLAAFDEKWLMAGLFGFFLALTRSNGLIVAIGVAIIYMEKINWSWRKIRWSALWLSLFPLGILSFMVSLLPITGDLLAPFNIQKAWFRQLSLPWDTLFNTIGPVPYITPIDQVLTIIFLILSVVVLLRFTSKSFGIYCLVSILYFLSTGVLYSASRYILILFPAFILMASWGRHRLVDRLILVVFTAFLAVLMAAWVRFYWVG